MARPHSATSSALRQATTVLSEYRPGVQQSPEHDPYHLSFLFQNNLVQYKCSCGNFRRINATYFCRHCMAIRCRSCVAHEVDSQYCQHCLEYIPTIDPKFQMNKCASCYSCPSCQHLLSTSILSIVPQSTDPSTQQDEVVKRTCQLICEFCRWSSAKFVTEGSRIISNLADVEVQNMSRITELIGFYKSISQREKTDKKKRRFHARSGNTMDLLKKYGIDNTLSPKLFESLRARTTFHDKSSSNTKYNLEPKPTEESSIDEFKPAEAISEEQMLEEKLDTSYYYNKDFNLNDVSSIEQRLAHVEIQPKTVANFRPISKSLSVKRSLRCKECERNLCRSEYSPVSIRFKIQSAAYYHVPELKIRSDVHPIKLELDKTNIVEFSVQNQTLTQVKLSFKKLEEVNEEDYELILPPPELSLGPKDDTADYEHVPLQIRPLNEDTHITFQSPFKVGFFIKVIPKRKVDSLRVKFSMVHDVLLIQNPKESERASITHTIQVDLGSVS